MEGKEACLERGAVELMHPPRSDGEGFEEEEAGCQTCFPPLGT